MIYPSIDKLLNIVDSKYKLVHIAADRAKVMKEHKHFQMNEDEYVSKKEIGRALEEIDKGLITIKNDSNVNALFNHSQIKKIYHMGLYDDESKDFFDKLNDLAGVQN